MQGYIALHRKLMDSWVCDDPTALALWVRMLLEATHKSKKVMSRGEVYNLNPGDLMFGFDRWCDKTGLSRQVLRKRIELFEKDGMITRSKHPKITVISIVNWTSYQADNTLTTSREHPENIQRTSREQEYNNVNNGNNVNNVNNRDMRVSEKPEPQKRAPRKKFVKPTFDEVMNYFIERGLEPFNANNKTEQFFAHYDSNGWKVGRNPMKDWKGAVRTWVAKMNGNKAPPKKPGETLQQYKDRTEYLKQNARQHLSED